MKIEISLDSACDASKEVIEEYGFNIVPFGVTMGDRFFTTAKLTRSKFSSMRTRAKLCPKPTR